MSGSFFVTPDEQPQSGFTPAPPVIESSVSEVNKLPQEDKQLLEKQSGITINSDKDLADAKKAVFNKLQDSNEGLRTGESAVPEVTEEESDNALQSAIDGATEVAGNTTESMGTALDYLKTKVEIGSEAIDLCKKFEIDCPICPEFPDLLGSFGDMSARFEFDGILDKILGFGDSDLFSMLTRCPDYLLKTASSRLGDISGKIGEANSAPMMKALVNITGKDKIPDLQKKVKTMSGGVVQTQENIAAFNEVATLSGTSKEDMVKTKPVGIDEKVVVVDDTVKGSNLGTKLFADVIDEDIQLMARALSISINTDPPPEEKVNTTIEARVEQQKVNKQENPTPEPLPVPVFV